MALIRSYAVWNNKGGVGKSTICFHLAARYAETHRNTNVLVIDACPQANVSMLLLGGGATGENNVLGLCTQALPRTIVGYLSQVIAAGPGAPLPAPMNFVTDVAQYNENLTNNLFLLCGDGNMEPMAPAISGAAAALRRRVTDIRVIAEYPPGFVLPRRPTILQLAQSSRFRSSGGGQQPASLVFGEAELGSADLGQLTGQPELVQAQWGVAAGGQDRMDAWGEVGQQRRELPGGLG